jgi:hypothetical protein
MREMKIKGRRNKKKKAKKMDTFFNIQESKEEWTGPESEIKQQGFQILPGEVFLLV